MKDEENYYEGNSYKNEKKSKMKGYLDDEINYEGKNFSNYRERQKKLDELAEREAYLRLQKNRLQAKQPWYRKPQNIIGIFAVLFPILISILFSFYKEDVKELSIYQSETEPLIIDSERIRTNVIIKQDSSEIKNIYKISFTIVNSGNVTLDKKDFSDGPINLIMDFKNATDETLIVEVFKRNDANQQNSVLNLKREMSKDIIQYMPSLLNKNDEIIIDVYLLSNSSLDVNVIGKIREGNVIGPIIRHKSSIDFGYKTMVQSIQSIFGYKWISISLLIILFIFTALSSVFQAAMLNEKTLEPKLLGILMTFTTSILSIFFIIVLVSIIVN